MKDIYEYNEVVVRFYDVVYDTILDKSGLNFYLEEIANAGGAVLEVGAGTGRILVPALNNGADIYGIEQSEFMLNRLKEKIPEKDFLRVSLQDVRDFSMDKKFNLIIAPFRVFGHLFAPDDQLKALNNIYEHLEEGGKFIFDLFVPDFKILTSERKNILEFYGEYEPGKKLKRFVTVEDDYINQLINCTFKFVWDEGGIEHSSESFMPLRYYFRYELENLIGRTKFKLEKIYGNFSKGELNNESRDFVIACKR